MEKALKINASDNVAVALTDLKKSGIVSDVNILEDIKSGHKFALEDIKQNEAVIKYNNEIGIATQSIKKGEWVHTHNLKSDIKETENYEFSGDIPYKTVESQYMFMGYERANGKVGIRNSIVIIPTVGCINKTCEIIKKRVEMYHEVDEEILVFTHPYGCSQLGDDREFTAKCISQLLKNPNIGGALLVSLGCENNNLEYMQSFLGDYDRERILTLVTQESDNEIADGVALIRQLAEKTSKDERTMQPLEKLTIGFKCGGSDSFSGITANPLCGLVTDYFTSIGGKVILTEVPEMFGAEEMLFKRCVNKDVFEKAVYMIDDFKKYFLSHNQVVYENPSPGNKEGGITTLEEKSSGCITKGGNSPITDVLTLYEECRTPGLSLLWGPGNDMVSITNLACAGATIILFTTGRGTPLGGIVPTIKISSNSALYEKKKEWIDFDAGEVLNGKSFEELKNELFKKIISVANGENTKNEINGYQEIAIFKDGITL